MSNDIIPPWLRSYLENRLHELIATRCGRGNTIDISARIDEIDRIFAQEEY